MAALLEIRSHQWEKNGEHYTSPFFVWVGNEPRFDLSTCNLCRHYRDAELCAMAEAVGIAGDDKLYPFCGHVCGYFALSENAEETLNLNLT